ncbi:MAG: hypothetical protein ACF8R7_10085 [Phycisphaerales bacterium JB039]
MNDPPFDSELPTSASHDIGDDVLRLTALLLIFYAGSDWLLTIPLKIACGGALFSSKLLRSWVLWLGISVLVVFIDGGAWHSIDNHKYLIAYWAICITLALSWPSRGSWIASRNASLLIGLCFFFAFLWKILAGEYFDGSFMHRVFLTDSRVAVPASLAGGVPISALSANRSLESMMQWSPSPDVIVELQSSRALSTIAICALYWTLLLEALIAFLWLIPIGKNSLVKDVALIAFILTTYVLLPVVGFATVLSVMGYAHASGRGRRCVAAAYLGVVALVQLASVPWGGLVSRMAMA